MWSCAIVCFALWHRGTPWKAATSNDPNYSSFISSQEKPSGSFSDSRHIPDDIPCKPFFASLKSRSIRKLFLQMLHPMSEERPTARYVLSKRAMKSVDCCCPDAVEENRPLVYFDAAGRDCHAGVSKMTVQTIHNHFPSRKKY
jgi:protein-serine/threonine kinase